MTVGTGSTPSAAAGAAPGPRLARMYVYPLKSARGIAVDEADIDATGLRHDRRWMVVDEGGDFVTARSEPRMLRIVPHIEDEVLRLSAPELPDLLLPLAPDAASRAGEARVWGDTVRADDTGDEAADWISSFLGARHRIVRFGAAAVRRPEGAYARDEDRVGFADGFPFLLTSLASLADLNRRLATPLVMERFRPNLVVAGGEPFAEDDWSEIRIGGTGFRVVKPCSRCSIVTLDPHTHEAGREPLRTLAGYRRRGGKVLFGQNLIHDGGGTLRVGDPLRVLRRR